MRLDPIPRPNFFQQISRHPRQLRLNASMADTARPMIADGVQETSAGLGLGTVFAFLGLRALAALASSACVAAYIFLKSSTAARLSLTRCRVLKRATTSDRCRRSGFLRGLPRQLGDRPDTYSRAFSSSSNRILSAVPSPETWSLPHSRHLSHPTQSMMRETLRKCDLNCSLRSCAA